jgi:hypothetical protein
VAGILLQRRAEAEGPQQKKPALAVNVTQVATIDLTAVLTAVIGVIGQLGRVRLHKIWRGIRLVLEPPAMDST